MVRGRRRSRVVLHDAPRSSFAEPPWRPATTPRSRRCVPVPCDGRRARLRRGHGPAADALRRQGRTGTANLHAARARSISRTCGGASTPALTLVGTPLPLTPREREIADRLVVSVRTVEGHLYRAGTKLGITNRKEFVPCAPLTETIVAARGRRIGAQDENPRAESVVGNRGSAVVVRSHPLGVAAVPVEDAPPVDVAGCLGGAVHADHGP